MNVVIYSVLFAFFISILLGPLLIPILHKLKFGQNIRKEGPRSHLKKAGTPTIGGLIFIISGIITMAIFVRRPNDKSMFALYSFLIFGLIGFIDDILKIMHKKNEGLNSKQKMLLILIASVFFAYYGKTNPDIGTSIIVPFLNKTIDLGFWYMPFIIFFYAATTNAVNLTDGLDGLASSVTILVLTFFCIVSFSMSYYTLSIFCGAIVGALLGFLRYNAFPAKVFMGDTGSLALGGAIAAVSMILKLPLIIIIVGGIYLIEALSVIIQVVSFKTTGKRVFKMTPIHHSFELSGWHETKIVSLFSIITVILCLIAFIALPAIK